jgi:hypothetical protein
VWVMTATRLLTRTLNEFGSSRATRDVRLVSFSLLCLLHFDVKSCGTSEGFSRRGLGPWSADPPRQRGATVYEDLDRL